MRKYILIILIPLCFVGCKANADITAPTTKTETRNGESIKSYPKLKIINKKSVHIFSIELPEYTISPLDILGGESMTFELNKGLLCYENVTVHLKYGSNRYSSSDYYTRVNFADGQTTVITLE